MEGRRTHTAGSSLGGAVALRRLLFDEKMLASLVMSSQRFAFSGQIPPTQEKNEVLRIL
jgi:hypothetical protein